MDVPKHPEGKELGLMILNPPFQKAAFRLIMKRCKDFGVPLLLLYPPAQMFAETAVTIQEDKDRTSTLNNCQIRHLVLPKRVIFLGDPGKKNANVKVDWFNLQYKPGKGSRRKDTKWFIDVDEWIAFVNEWTTNEKFRLAAAKNEDETQAAYLRDVVNHVNQSDSQSEGEGEGETHAPPPTDSVPMAEQKEDIPEDQKQEKDVDDLADVLSSTTINNNQSDAPAPENARSTSMVSNLSSSSETSEQRFTRELAAFGQGTPEHESANYAAVDDESVDMNSPDWMN